MYPMLSAYSAHKKCVDCQEANVEIWSSFITDDERQELLAWSATMRPHLAGNGANRQYRQTDDLPNCPPLYGVVRERLEQTLQLSDPQREPMFGWYLSIIDEGGAVHGHLDPTRPGRRHLRCNIFLQLPEIGGLPIIEGRARQVSPGDLLAFFPSEKRHRSEAVGGGKARIILSFGYLVQINYSLPQANLAHVIA